MFANFINKLKESKDDKAKEKEKTKDREKDAAAPSSSAAGAEASSNSKGAVSRTASAKGPAATSEAAPRHQQQQQPNAVHQDVVNAPDVASLINAEESGKEKHEPMESEAIHGCDEEGSRAEEEATLSNAQLQSVADQSFLLSPQALQSDATATPATPSAAAAKGVAIDDGQQQGHQPVVSSDDALLRSLAGSLLSPAAASSPNNSSSAAPVAVFAAASAEDRYRHRVLDFFNRYDPMKRFTEADLNQLVDSERGVPQHLFFSRLLASYGLSHAALPQGGVSRSNSNTNAVGAVVAAAALAASHKVGGEEEGEDNDNNNSITKTVEPSTTGAALGAGGSPSLAPIVKRVVSTAALDNDHNDEAAVCGGGDSASSSLVAETSPTLARARGISVAACEWPQPPTSHANAAGLRTFSLPSHQRAFSGSGNDGAPSAPSANAAAAASPSPARVHRTRTAQLASSSPFSSSPNRHLSSPSPLIISGGIARVPSNRGGGGVGGGSPTTMNGAANSGGFHRRQRSLLGVGGGGGGDCDGFGVDEAAASTTDNLTAVVAGACGVAGGGGGPSTTAAAAAPSVSCVGVHGSASPSNDPRMMVLGPDLSSTTAAGGVMGGDGANIVDDGTAAATEEWSPAWDAIAAVFLPSTSFQPKTWNSNNNTATNPNSKYVVLDDDAGGGGGEGGFYRPEAADGYGGFYVEDEASGFGYGYCDDDFEEFRGMDDGAATPSSAGGGAGIGGRRGGPTSSVLPSTAASSFATTPSFVSGGGVGRPLPMLKKGSTARLQHHHRRESSSTGAGGFKSSSLATPTAAQLHNQSSAKYRPSSGGHHHHNQQQQQQIQQNQPQRPTIFGEDGRPFRMPRGMARHGQRIIYGGVHMLIDHRNMLAGPDGRALRLLNAQSPHAWEAVLGIVPLAETGTSATSPSNAKKKAHASTIGGESTSTNGGAIPETYDEARRRAVEELAGAENVVAAAAANLPGLARVPSVCAVNSGASFANNHAGAALTAAEANATAAADDDAIVAAILDRRRDALIDRAEARLRRSMLLLGGRRGGHLGGRVGGGGAANGRTRNKNVTEEGMGVVRAVSSFSSAASSSSSSGSSLYSSDDDRNDSFTSSVISELSDLAAIRDVELYRFEHGNVTSSSVGPKGGTGGGEDSGYALSDDEERENFEALSRLVAARQSAMADQRALIAALNFPTTEAKLMAEQAERRRRAEADDRRRISEAFAACAAGAPLHDVAAAAGGANAWRYGPSAYSIDGAAAHTTKHTDAAPLPRPTSGASSLDSSPTPAHRYGPSSGIIGHSLLPLPFATKSRGYAHITAVDDILLGLDDSFASGSTAGRSLQSPVDVLEDGADNEEGGEDDGAEDDDVAAEHRARFGAPIAPASAAAVAGAVGGDAHASAALVGRSLDFSAASASPQRHLDDATPTPRGEVAAIALASAAKEESSPMKEEQQQQPLLVESPMGGASALSEVLPATPATMGAVGKEEALLLFGRGEHQPAVTADKGGYVGFDNDEDDGGLAMMDPNQI